MPLLFGEHEGSSAAMSEQDKAKHRAADGQNCNCNCERTTIWPSLPGESTRQPAPVEAHSGEIRLKRLMT
jgi:hypothetical protein